MVRNGPSKGPNNTIHNFLDIACRGFSEKARKDFKKNQKNERDTRERKHVRKDPYIGAANSMPDIIADRSPLPSRNWTLRGPDALQVSLGGNLWPGMAPGLGIYPPQPFPDFIPRDPGARRPEIMWPGQVPIQPPQPSPGMKPRRQSAPESKVVWPGSAPSSGIQPLPDSLRPQRTPQSSLGSRMSNGQIHEPSAYPMSENPNESVRIPTHQVPLGDNQRTIIEGLRLPTNHRQTSRCIQPSRRYT
jgi:hypothetical protein